MNKGQLKAAFAKGARIQAWHLLPGATNSNQGQWDTLWPTDEPEFGCEAHLYRVHPEDISLIAELGQEVGAVAWIAPSSLESLNICRKDEHNGFVEVWMRPDEHRTIPLYTSPAHTSEARDAVMTGAGDSDDLPAFLEWVAGEVVRRDTRAGNFAEGLAQSLRGRAHILRIVKKDAAMRQEAE